MFKVWRNDKKDRILGVHVYMSYIKLSDSPLSIYVYLTFSKTQTCADVLLAKEEGDTS